MQQVKAWYIYILGVKRLDFIIKSWITSFMHTGPSLNMRRHPGKKLTVWQNKVIIYREAKR